MKIPRFVGCKLGKREWSVRLAERNKKPKIRKGKETNSGGG